MRRKRKILKWFIFVNEYLEKSGKISKGVIKKRKRKGWRIWETKSNRF